MSLSENTRASLRLGSVGALVGTLVGLVVGAVSVRDKALADIRTEIQAAVSEERAAREKDLRHFVTREELLVLLDARLDRLENRLIARLGRNR